MPPWTPLLDDGQQQPYVEGVVPPQGARDVPMLFSSEPTPNMPTTRERDQQQRIDDATRTGFLPKAIAIAAALGGDFRPASQLLEQERKTQFFKAVQPDLQQIDTLTASGEREQAGAAISKLAGRIGDRAPELTGFLRDKNRQLYEESLRSENIKGAVNFLKAAILPNLGEDDPKREAIAAAEKLGKSGTRVNDSMALALLKPIFEEHVQFSADGQVHVRNAYSGKVSTSQLQAGIDPSQFSERAKTELPARFGTDMGNIVNIMRGNPYRDNNGNMVQPSPALQSEVKQAYAQYQGQQGQLDIAKNIPTTPEMVLQQQGQGFDPWGIATRQTGGAPGAQATQAGLAQQAARVAGDVAVETAMRDPLALEKSGNMAVNMTPGADFGSPVPATSIAGVRQSGNDVGIINQKAYEQHVTPALQALNKIANLSTMFTELGITDDASYMTKLEAGVRRTLENRFGIALDEGSTPAKAAAAIVNSGIRDLVGSGTVGDKEGQRLTDMVTGALNAGNIAGATSAVRILQQRGQEVLGQYMSKMRVQQNEALRTSNASEDWLPLADKYKVDAGLARAVLSNEGSKDGQVSPAGAVSRWQLTVGTPERPGTAVPYLTRLGRTVADLVNPSTQRQVSNEVAMMHLAGLQTQYPGRPDLALAAYHGGAGAVLPDGSVNPRSQERNRPDGTPGKRTVDYVKDGMARLAKEQKKTEIFTRVPQRVR